MQYVCAALLHSSTLTDNNHVMSIYGNEAFVASAVHSARYTATPIHCHEYVQEMVLGNIVCVVVAIEAFSFYITQHIAHSTDTRQPLNLFHREIGVTRFWLQQTDSVDIKL